MPFWKLVAEDERTMGDGLAGTITPEGEGAFTHGRESHHRCRWPLFVWIPEPLTAIASKLALSGDPARAREFGLDRLDAATRWGLPYEIDASLWRVRPIDPTVLAPFEEQARRCADTVVPASEQRHVLGRFAILEPVVTWTPEVAERFAVSILARLRLVLLGALANCRLVLESIETEDSWSVDDRPDERALELLGGLVVLWRQTAHGSETADLAPFARSVAYASAVARELAAQMYAEVSAPPLQVTRGESFLEARRWQARILSDLILDAPGPAAGRLAG